MHRTAGLAALSLLSFIFMACCCGGGVSKPAPEPSPGGDADTQQQAAGPEPAKKTEQKRPLTEGQKAAQERSAGSDLFEPKVTMDAYEALQKGMSYAEACRIIGSSGEEMSRVEIPGAPRTILYTWSNWNGSNMNAMFQNDRLISKAQIALPRESVASRERKQRAAEETAKRREADEAAARRAAAEEARLRKARDEAEAMRRAEEEERTRPEREAAAKKKALDDAERAAAAKLSQAKQLQQLDKRGDAIEVLEGLINRWPATKAAAEAKELLGKLKKK